MSKYTVEIPLISLTESLDSTSHVNALRKVLSNTEFSKGYTISLVNKYKPTDTIAKVDGKYISKTYLIEPKEL